MDELFFLLFSVHSVSIPFQCWLTRARNISSNGLSLACSRSSRGIFSHSVVLNDISVPPHEPPVQPGLS